MISLSRRLFTRHPSLVTRHSSLVTALALCALAQSAHAQAYTLSGAGVAAFSAPRGITPGDTTYTLGIPTTPRIRDTTDANENVWLANNARFCPVGIFDASGGVSSVTVAGRPRIELAAAEGAFPIERAKPDYYLADQITPPQGVDWPATYDLFLTRPESERSQFVFDEVNHRVFTASGGTLAFTWVLTNGGERAMTYNVSPSCSGRPRRIYWTDAPYNGPSIDLSGKFVKFFGPDSIVNPVYGVTTNYAGGMEQVVSNKVVSGLHIDASTHMLYASGQMRGQVVMAYYDTGLFETLLHVQPVEICRPAVIRMTGEIGRALHPDGRGYNVKGLRARPTYNAPTDNRGDYYYQHQGQQSYSPKHGNVYPLRPTVEDPWNMEVYWMETDEMLVQWPFEIDQYACDWPFNATVFVRGDVGGDAGRPIYIPSDYTATLMKYQEPEGHARAVDSDGTFRTTGEGWSLLKLVADDNVWFVPVHSILRSNTQFFTLEPEDIRVGVELRMRGGAVSGLADGFTPDCDPDSPGYIYEAASAPIWNPGLYKAAQPDNSDSASSTNVTETAATGTGTNEYASVIYAVTANVSSGSPSGTPRSSLVEVWWNTTIKENDMPKALEIPTLPQVYSVRWPADGETPQIVIASQLGSASESVFSHNAALYLSDSASSASLPARKYFDESDGGTVMFWVKLPDAHDDIIETAAVIGLRGTGENWSKPRVYVGLLKAGSRWNVHFVNLRGGSTDNYESFPVSGDLNGWVHVALRANSSNTDVLIDGRLVTSYGNTFGTMLANVEAAAIGKFDYFSAADGATVGELLFWNKALSDAEIASEMFKVHTGRENHLTGCFTFVNDEDLAVNGTDSRTFTDKVLGTVCTAWKCLCEENGPPARGTGVIDADNDSTPRIYAQNDQVKTGYNPNEEHAMVMPGSGGHIAWALRTDLNTAASSRPGVLVEYVKNGRKTMQWFDVAVTNSIYPELAADCVAGLAFPGPHPIDLMDNPWCAEDKWDEPSATAPAFRDRKGQLWARAAGTATMRMYYRMQDGFAFPSIDKSQWPAVGKAVPWLSLLGGDPASAAALSANPAPWTWRVRWPDAVPEIEIGRTLTTAASGLPEVWNAGSVGVVWPATDDERAATAVLFDPTVAQTAGFSKSTFATVAAAVASLGIKQGAGGNATLRRGRWYFDDLPPSISSRFYLDTTADVGSCLKLEGKMEDNPGGVSLLHVNVLSDDERATLRTLLDDKASATGKTAWHNAIDSLATATVLPSPHKAVSDSEERIDYQPRDHYALFTMGATNYVTLIENDSTNELMKVAEGDPISMHLIRVVPKYYVARVVTREDPINLLSQQLSVLYAEAFAGSPGDYVFEWRKCRPHADGTVPENFEDEYTLKFPITAGLTRFVLGGQGDTLANMVNTYYAMRYKAASPSSPAYAAMGDAWSAWTTPPALAEGWVQRVLNNVTPFAQRMRDFTENTAETAVSMLRQAGGPYEGDVALSQDNLTSVGLIQLYETILSKAESMSLLLGLDDADANKQLQLAVARLADLYSTLGDEAYVDALNPTIGFGGSFNTPTSWFDLDYGTLSSSLFCFDNQVPTLLDEELALLRGRSGENAPSVRISPYYNRLPWNVTKSPVGGEVAYMVNYDISDTAGADGQGDGLIDEKDAAVFFPQGHGDAYGHYLSALAGYYRLLRNPYFSWGEPAMGEMVVADSVLNVDYYDEAKFAKAAYDVAKTAALVVDRTARKAWRDNGGAPGAGYLDNAPARNFGYGEWGSRGVFGALANWAVANALIDEAPDGGKYSRYWFDGRANSLISATIPESVPCLLNSYSPWTIEMQIVPGQYDAAETGGLLFLSDDSHILSLVRNAGGTVSALFGGMEPVTNSLHISYWIYTNGVDFAVADDKNGFVLNITEGDREYACLFVGSGDVPTAFPDGYDVANFADNPPEFPGWGCFREYEKDQTDLVTGATVLETQSGLIEFDLDTVIHQPANEPLLAVEIGEAPEGRNTLVALRSGGTAGSVEAILLDASGALVASTNFALPSGFSIDLSGEARATLGGAGYQGEIGEIRVWGSAVRSYEQLRAQREFVSPISGDLALYLRTFADTPTDSLQDIAEKNLFWYVSGGRWIEASASGINVAFEDEGLLRIDRSTVPELSALADVIPDIQKKVDRMDAGLTPLGLADGAMAFDLTPIKAGDGGKTHFEQIRERAGTALENARRSLEKAQEYGSRLRLLAEASEGWENSTATTELETKNKLIEYFGYPYEGDIGPAGTYPQGYDGPDIYNYAWMDLETYGITSVKDTVAVTRTVKSKPAIVNVFVPFWPSSSTEATDKWTFEKSATGFIVKPKTVTGRRRAQGKIQNAMGEFLVAYASLESRISNMEDKLADFEGQVFSSSLMAGVTELKATATAAGGIMDYVTAGKKLALKVSINSLENMKSLSQKMMESMEAAIPEIQGAGMTVNIDPKALASAVSRPAYISQTTIEDAALLSAKNALAILEAGQSWTQIAKALLGAVGEIAAERLDTYTRLRSMWYELRDASSGMMDAYRELQAKQAAVETVVAEAERIIDERTLARQQASGTLTKARYNEMFFRLARNAALSRYDAQFELAQKYCYLAAQAYDYETGLLSADPASGDAFLARIVGARAIGEFDDDGNPLAAADGAKRDGGLAAILAEMDANWLVLKPRLGINNPQPYATWFSLRHDLFRILPGEKGEKAWRTELRKYMVDDLNQVAEFRHYCQPLAGGTAEKEPGLVIPFPTFIGAGRNFFGEELAGDDAALDPTWFATHVSAAGVHFEGYVPSAISLSRTPSAYLVPVGEDRMRAVGDPETVLSWKVVDQTIPAPYAIGSAQLDDPDWTPLYDGATGGNDFGARIRKHPSFRAYYAPTGTEPSDSSLDCTRLVGRSAWNTRWLLIVPASSLGADREAALATFVNAVTDLKLGLKTYSTSGN